MAALDLTDDGLPALFLDADQASIAAQRKYLKLVWVDILLVIGAAALGSLSPQTAESKAGLALASAVAFAGSILVSAVLATLRPDRSWYEGRAIAESVKTLAWKYAVRAEPYDGTESDADTRFAADLSDIIQQRRHLAAALIPHDPTRQPMQITRAMRDLRSAPFDIRLAVYLASRIENQRAWYRRRSSASHRSEGLWFAVLVTAQALGFVAAVTLVRWPAAPVNGIGFFAAVAGGAAAWMQVRQHQELSQSYAIAAHELGLVHIRGGIVTTDEALSQFVSDAENAVSREHTLWVARREG